MKSLSALLIVDLQNDFLSQDGAFSKWHIEPQQLCDAVNWLVQAARQQQRQVVWIASNYGEVTGEPEELQGKTHIGKFCCVKDTWGSKIVPALQSAFEQRTDDELAIVKYWYDAFVGVASQNENRTTLHEWLQAKQITKLSICGVPTNVCVFQTAKSALRLGYQVEILEEATSASTPGKHLLAIRELEKLGGTTRHWGELLSESNPVRLSGIAGDSSLDCAALSSCIDESTFETLHDEVAWHHMIHRGSAVPRLIALQGMKEADGVEPLYRHPADEQPPLTYWTPTVDAIRQEVEGRIGHPLNHCLIQLYRNGRDFIGEHADKTLDVMRPSLIVNVSLGATRSMLFRSKTTKGTVPQKLPLPHGSLFMLNLESNQKFYHGIKQLGSDSTDALRISLTLRYIGTYYDPINGAVWGIGAPSKTRAEANARVKWSDSLSLEEKLAKETAEADCLLRLFREENINENFDANAYQPGFDILDFQGFVDRRS
ncbi:isochorismatase family protein [Chamaesiphon minutus]|uniref:Nicotinamidase-like amidase n=1 Tax=Chamaesiphon minutus (strain ATCC 27169 / PCC 6605) TaxID=1173020 RepID=K9UM34_CHAP6|nr:isochorismatase family protein [Chamaesiphon minutus]AFY95718.1 nicotinamidase-like amidase [Chamaesiphon minutus PCC 6605]